MWFYNLIDNSDVIFIDYTKAEIIDFMENNYPEDLNYMSTFVKDTDLKEEFNKHIRKHHIYPPCYTITTTVVTKSDGNMKELFGLFIAVVS